MSSLLDCWTGQHSLFPRFERGEGVDVDARPACACDPAPVGNVGDSAFGAGEVGRGGAREVCVENRVETAGLGLVAVYAIWDGFGGVAGEVVWGV